MKSCFQLYIFEIIQFFNLSKTNKNNNKLKTNTLGLGLLLSAPQVVEAGGEASDLRLNAVDLRVHVGAVGVRACVVLLVALPVGHHDVGVPRGGGFVPDVHQGDERVFLHGRRRRTPFVNTRRDQGSSDKRTQQIKSGEYRAER
jgi:hypothetical protein